MKVYALQTNHVDLEIELEANKANITACFTDVPLSTKNIHSVLFLLNSRIPTIFDNKCFNDDHQTFHEEVQSTEIGHLFEHVLMEYMCIVHEAHYITPIKIKGLTSWNWHRHPVGTFSIQLKTVALDEDTFIRALNQTIALFEEMIYLNKTRSVIPDYIDNYQPAAVLSAEE